MVLVPDHGTQLELRCRQGGISPAAPPRPKPQLQSVPPILRRQHQNSMPGYSKGAQGLSVYVRVTGIFTGATDSPSALRRQCPNHYAIRAGRKLPDTEFRSVAPECFQTGWTLPWTTSIHLISNPADLVHSGCRQVIARFHSEKNRAELFKIHAFLRLQRVLYEKWDDALEQILLTPHPEGHPIAVVRANHSATEELLQGEEQLYVAFVLHDGEFRQYLEASLHIGVLVQSNEKTRFSVHETCDPLCIELHRSTPNVKSLRVPAAMRAFPADCPHVRWIFTASDSLTSTRRLFEEFPAYGSV